MKKNIPRKIIYTECNCSSCKYLKKENINVLYICSLAELPSMITTKSINLLYDTPNWCPILSDKNIHNKSGECGGN